VYILSELASENIHSKREKCQIAATLERQALYLIDTAPSLAATFVAEILMASFAQLVLAQTDSSIIGIAVAFA